MTTALLALNSGLDILGRGLMIFGGVGLVAVLFIAWLDLRRPEE